MSSIPLDDTPQKECRICQIFKSATRDFFHINQSNTDGLNTICKDCRNARARTKPVTPTGYRQCTICKELKPATIEHFHSDKQRKGGVSYICRPCHKEYTISLAKTREPLPEGYQKQCTSCQEWKPGSEFTKHPTTRDGLNALCRYCVSIYAQQYGQENKDKIIAHLHTPASKQRRIATDHTRRTRKQAFPGTYMPEQIQKQLERQNYCCYYAACGYAKFKKRNGEYVFTIDHTFPISRATGEDPINDIGYLVLSCKPCNSKKNKKYPWEWYEGGRLL